MKAQGAIESRLPAAFAGRRRAPARDWWLVGAGLALAALAGHLAGTGDWRAALIAVAAPAFLVLATAAPERTALALLVALPFLFYPATVGSLSLFIALPLFGYTGLTMMLRARRTSGALSRQLPVAAFALLLAFAVAAATLSTDVSRAFSRVLYLLLFGWFAWALASAILSGRLSRVSIARAVVIGSGVAAIAVSAQFLAQFVADKQTVIDWLHSVDPTFAGKRAAGIEVSNWVLDGPDLLRGVFPFMSPASAGQYLMLSFITAVWLRGKRTTKTGLGSALELGLIMLIAAGLLVTFSRQAWVGAAVGLIALGVRRRPGWVLAAVFWALLLAAVVPIPGGHGSFGEYLLSASDTSTTSTATRVDLWRQAVDLIPANALVGVGPGLFDTLSPSPSHPLYYAHNVFLDEAVEVGVGGALALAAMFLLALRGAWKRGAMLAFALIAAYLTANLFDDVLYFPRNLLLLAVAFALIAATPRSAASEGPPSATDRGRARRRGSAAAARAPG
jgi:O-antigen ligase